MFHTGRDFAVGHALLPPILIYIILDRLKLTGIFMSKYKKFMLIQTVDCKKTKTQVSPASTVHLYPYNSKHVIQFILLNAVFC